MLSDMIIIILRQKRAVYFCRQTYIRSENISNGKEVKEIGQGKD